MDRKFLRLKRAARAVLLVLLLGAVGTTNALALDFTEGNLTYTVNEGGTSVTVTGHANGTSATGALDIPQSVTHGAYTYAVTDIEDYAFSNCTGITSVTIPSTMTSIGYAFSGCSGLLSVNYNATNCTVAASGGNSSGWYWEHWLSGCSSLVSLIIGENVQVIPNHFVDGCGSLVGMLTIPNSVTSIGYDAFYGCSGFAAVSIGNSVTSIGSEAFWNCSGIVSVSIPNSVTTIGYEAFYGCSSLTSVTIPNSITSIEQSTFYGCSSLASVSIGNGVASIESDAFSNCTSLTSVSLPNSLVSIGNYAFSGCGNLPSITIPDAVLSIGESAFEGCGLNSVSIGSSVASIGNSAFSGCGFTSVTIPNSVVSIGNSVFSGCGNLASVILGTSVYSIGDYVFSGCSSLTSIEIPASVASIGTGAFQNCIGLGQITVASGNPILDSRDNCNAIIQTASNKLIVGCKNTVIPSTVTIIGEQAFYGCTGLTSITLPDDLTSIEDYAFLNCTGISSVTIPSAVTSIGFDAFSDCTGLFILNYNATNCVGNGFTDSYFSHWLSGCSSLVSLNIGENVQTIPAYFVCNNYGGYNLAGMLTIPNSVTSIGSYAFFNCHGFTAVTIGNSVTSIGDWAFASCTSLVSVSIPNSVVLIGGSAFASCTSLVSVTLPSSLTSIGEFAFGYCDNLDSISIPDAVVSIGHNAFYSCDNLTFLSLGSALASIGSEAFLGCNNLGVIIDHAETPPYLGRDAFSSVSANIPVYVPCESVEAYVSANWGGFTNIMGMCAGEISVTANPVGGGTVSGGGAYEGGATCTLGATSYGYLPFLNWTKDGEVVSTNPNYSFVVTGDASYVANFGQIAIGDDFQIGSGTATKDYLPSYSYYKYSLTQQIYTAGEMGGMPGVITSIAFFNAGSEKTRNYDIYMVNTEKSSFVNSSDWIAVGAGDLVFSGDVTLPVGEWTTITFDTPFNYDGVNNLALIVDDNTGSYSNSPHMSCRVFDADGYQALYKYDDGTNYNPYNPSSISGTRLSVKNQIKLGIASTTGTNIEFADEAVKTLCVANWDTDGDGELSYVEAAAVTDLGTVFKNNTTITSFDELQYFTGLTSIESETFYSCSNLVSVQIPVTVETVESRAFTFCSNLTSITIPSSVTNMGSAFTFCPGLEQIVVAEGNTTYDSRNGCNAVIETATNKLVSGCKNTVIPNGITVIGTAAFAGHSTLLSINFPNTLTTIMLDAFIGCHSLNEIALPNALTTIGFNAFESCRSLTSLTLPASVTSLASTAFEGCSGMGSIVVEDGNTVYDSRNSCNAVIETATNTLVSGCKNSIIPESVVAIGNSAFSGHSGLVSIEIPDAVTSIGDRAFAQCSGLSSIVIPDAVTSIGHGAFQTCSSLTSIVIPDLVSSIEEYAFNWCDNLRSVTLGSSVATIEEHAFSHCTMLDYMAIRAEVPPTINGSQTFYEVPTNLTVYVPCGHENAYASISWGGFSNFVGMCPVEITATANPTAGGTVAGAGTYDHGTTATLTATANAGYTFVNWTRNGAVVSTNATYSFTVLEGAAYVANFSLNSYAITATANPTEGGTVAGAGTYDHGTTATLTATANVGYTFMNWTLGDEVVSNSPAYTFTVTEAGDYVANFSLNSYAITATANPTEGGTVAGAGTYDHGTTATLTATANVGYTFMNWTRDGAVVSTNATYSFTVLEGAAYVANFSLNSYAITATANPTIGGTVTGSGTYYYLETASLTATPNTGYRFVNWTKNGTAVSANTTLSFTVTEAADYVANFETYSYNITALANPSVGGTVSGAGAYDYGETVTLTATPNANYSFVNWTENGVEVSTEATYSFTVEGSRSLVANFDHEYYWAVDPFAYESTMTIIGIVQINGEEQLSNLFEVGAFSGEECRGREWLTDQYYADLGHYLLFLTVYGNNSADEITFRLFDHAAGVEVDKTCVATLTFEADAIYGSNANPFVFNFIDANVAQTSNFSNGWNWWSSFIELDAESGLQSLENNLGTRGMMIKSQNDGYASYLDGFGWYGSLSAINNESSYQIRTNEACTVEMTGFVVNPAEHPIELHTGWTWVGYPVNVTMGIADAMSGIAPLNSDMLKSQNDGFASYLEGFGWYGSLNILNPGMGLMYKSNNGSTVTLVYPNNTTRTDLKANQTTEGNHWQPNLNAYADNMSVMAVVELDGIELQGENYELAVFANGEVRGSARLLYVEPLNRYMAFLTVAGDEAAGLNFGLYDTETGAVETQCFASLPYETNAIIGSFDEPYVVSFRSTTGMDEWASSLQVFPNPVEHGRAVSLGFDGVETSKVTVEIINALGSVVETLRATSLQRITAPETAGVYTLKITVEGKGTGYRKLVVR